MSDPVAVGGGNGIHVEYFEKPYRHYTLEAANFPHSEVPSVTSALGELDKPALVGWAANVTTEGAWALNRRDGYSPPRDMRVPRGARAFRLPGKVTSNVENGVWLYKWADVDAVRKSDPAALVRVPKNATVLDGWRLMQGHLRQLGLDHRSTTKGAQDRGLDLHSILEDWVERRQIPAPGDHLPAHRGYMRALSKWLLEWSPKFLESELIVGSAEHGFAGRRDTVATVDAASLPESVLNASDFPKAARDGGRLLLDLKTSKGVYPASQFRQLAAYEIAGVECGAEPTVAQGIIRVGADGNYEPKWSDATADDFLHVLAVYKDGQKWRKR